MWKEANNGSMQFIKNGEIVATVKRWQRFRRTHVVVEVDGLRQEEIIEPRLDDISDSRHSDDIKRLVHDLSQIAQWVLPTAYEIGSAKHLAEQAKYEGLRISLLEKLNELCGIGLAVAKQMNFNQGVTHGQ